MTEEEKKAIENLTDLLSQRNEKQVKITTYDLFENIETVLNLIQKQDKEIEHWKNGFERELEDNRKNTCELLKQDLIIREKDKQIDLSAEFIKNNMSEKKIINEICIKGKCNNEECHEDDLKECIKLHFEKLAKEKGE